MGFAKVRAIVFLIIAVVLITFVRFSASRTEIRFSFYGGEDTFGLAAWAAILLSVVAGFILGYLFRITHPSRKRAPKTPEK